VGRVALRITAGRIRRSLSGKGFCDCAVADRSPMILVADANYRGPLGDDPPIAVINLHLTSPVRVPHCPSGFVSRESSSSQGYDEIIPDRKHAL
jgi:hypothetical protein